ncbi:MAG: hypothetical protein EXQ56_06280 [Acidobacteria bacterium]|nr:hypothetical protein [Acidobacteriota bacterium]
MRNLAGQATKLSRTMHDIRYDSVNDEILVTNPFAQAIITFRGDADGNATPLRIIQGPKTQLGGVDRLDVDVVNNEILVPDGDRILVYPRAANGDVAPLRIIEGANTQLRSATTLSVDPVHNLLAVGLNKAGRAITMNADGTMSAQSADADGALMVFNRLDKGNVAPRTLVRGPKSGIVRITQMAVYSPRKFMIATQPGEITVMEPEEAFVGVWSLDDNGNVPPLYRIGVGPKTTMKKPRGVVLNPRNKEMIIADMRLNAVLTFSFPEIF